MGVQLNPKDGARIEHVPVIKLPADKLDGSLVALVKAKNGLRKEVTDNILSQVYPSKWSTKAERSALEKRFMRALVAPALTRTHFARSSPPYFLPAPNGSLMRGQDDEFRKCYTSICLFDFATLGLGLAEDLLPPKGSLRDHVRDDGDAAVDRVRGLDAILRFYLKFHPERNLGAPGKFSIGHAKDYANKSNDLFDLLDSAMPTGRIIQVDMARELILKRMYGTGVLVSSFVADEWIRMAIRALRVSSFKAPYAAIDSLMDGTNAIGGVMLPTRGG